MIREYEDAEVEILNVQQVLPRVIFERELEEAWRRRLFQELAHRAIDADSSPIERPEWWLYKKWGPDGLHVTMRASVRCVPWKPAPRPFGEIPLGAFR